MSPSRPWPLAAALAVVLLPLLVALAGVRGPRTIEIKLGPGDGPFVDGFAEEPEMPETGSTHAFGTAAALRFPLVARGTVDASWELKRILPHAQATRVTLGDDVLDVDDSEGRQWHARGGRVVLAEPRPLHFALRSEGLPQADGALKMHAFRVAVGEDGRVRLDAAAAAKAAVVVALVLGLMLAFGWAWPEATAGALAASLPLAIALALDPWFTFRLLRGLPEGLLLFGGASALFARWLVARGHAPQRDVAIVGAIGLVAFLGRALLVNHPDYYYPDLRTHVTLVLEIRDAGWRMFTHPYSVIQSHGVWVKKAYGRTFAFPYAPLMHVLFAPFARALGYDGLMTAMKVTSAFCTAVPVAILWAIARRLDVPPLGAALTILLPTYSSRLTYAFLGSLFGHMFHLGFVLYLIWYLREMDRPRRILGLGINVALAQLAYVSGILMTALVVPITAAGVFFGKHEKGRRRALGILAAGLLGCAISIALYYRDFVDMAIVVIRSGAQGKPTSLMPVQPFLPTLVGRTLGFFGWWWPPLAAAGLWLVWRRAGEAHHVLLSWPLDWMVIIYGRARYPDAIAHAHEAMLISPWMCLLAGVAVGTLWRRGGAFRWAAGAILAVLAAWGFHYQWIELLKHLHRFG